MVRRSKRKQSPPPLAAANPGHCGAIHVDFSNKGREWAEDADPFQILADVLRARGIKAKHEEEGSPQAWLELENGWIVRPGFFQMEPQDDDSVRTSTTIDMNHPELCPGGIFEYQHAAGATMNESLRAGFEGWAATDLPVLIDASREKPEICTFMILEYPATRSLPARKRQILFGPPVRTVTRGAAKSKEEHEYCPCCLLTNSMEAFQRQIEGNDFCGVRLYAARNSKGGGEVDCRVNGVDWALGKAALKKYVKKWPDRGFEFRKQFVAIRTLE
jgi:hypothetical protein